jgi:hypothetical protein
MKPTPQNSPSQHTAPSFPVTDYSFHETLEARTRAAAVLSEKRPLGLHRLSDEFFRGEAEWVYLTELAFFCLITAISAWPMATALAAVVRLARNY